MAIFFYGCTTLDGFLADKNHQIDWLHEIGSVEETSYDEFYSEMDILIMGRRTYDDIKEMPDLEKFYGKTQNYVFTHKSKENTALFEFISTDIVDFVSNIPKEKNIWIVGGNSLIAPLLDKQLIDKIYLQLAPVLLGEGIPLFTQKEGKQLFDLIEVKKYGQFAELVLEKHHH